MPRRHAGLEVGHPRDLARDQQHAVEQERRLPLLDDVEAGSLERRPTRRRQLDLVAGRGHPPSGPELRVQQHGQVARADPLDQPVHASDVVEVAVTEHDGFEAVGRDAQPVQVRDQSVGCDAGVVQHAATTPVVLEFDEGGVAVLRPQEVEGGASLGHIARNDRQRTGRAGQTPAADQATIGQQHVGRVVDQGGQIHSIDRNEIHESHGHPAQQSGPPARPAASVRFALGVSDRAIAAAQVGQRALGVRGAPRRARSRPAGGATSRPGRSASLSRAPSQPVASLSTGPHAVSVHVPSRKAPPGAGVDPGERVRQAAVLARRAG